MWKDFFYYSKSERRAIIVLLALAVVVLTGILWCGRAGNSLPVMVDGGDAEIDSFVAQIKEREKTRSAFSGYSRRYAENQIQPVLQTFDPNLADSLTFRRLGISAFVTRNILRYRASGGRFRSPEAFARIYGLTDSQFVALKPYISISPEFLSRRDTSFIHEKKEQTFPPKYEEGTLVSLNEADTAQLRRVPGIGAGLARMIVAYRHRLGGFSRVEQLQEIPHLGDEVNRWFTLKDGPYRKLRVNHDGLDRLRNHPYMDFYKAKAILEYRRKRGRIKDISQMAMFEEFSEEDIRLLSPYFSFE